MGWPRRARIRDEKPEPPTGGGFGSTPDGALVMKAPHWKKRSASYLENVMSPAETSPRTTGSRTRPPTSQILVMTLSMVLSGCATLFPEPEPTPCEHESTVSDPERVDAERVVMLDLSASLWRTEEGSLDLSDRLAELIVDEDFHRLPGTRLVTLGVFDGGSVPSAYTVWELPPSDRVDDVVALDIEDFRSCVEKEYLPAALEAGPLAPGSDVMGGISDGEAGFVRGTGPDTVRRLVVVTDGRSNTGCVDLTELTEEWAPADEVAESTSDVCRSTGEWPADDLAGVDVDLHLLTNAQEGDSRESHSWLSDLWLGLCEASSATCSVSPPRSVDREARVTDGGPPKGFPEDPPVFVPAWQEPCEIQELPGDLLFPHDSSTARPEAVELLTELAEHNRECADGPVAVTGHTDSQGDHDYNDDLSLRRAEFVADRLREHGFTDVTASGSGAREPVCPGDYDGNDDVDDPCPAANRRVVVDFTVGEG